MVRLLRPAPTLQGVDVRLPLDGPAVHRLYGVRETLRVLGPDKKCHWLISSWAMSAELAPRPSPRIAPPYPPRCKMMRT